MCPDTTLDGAGTKSIGQRVSCDLCRLLKARRIASLDFVPERRSLTIGDGCISRRCGSACVIDRFGRNICKTRGSQSLANRFEVVITVRSAGHEQGWIVREDRGHRFRNGLGKFVFADCVPYIEEKTTTRFEHAAGFLVTRDPVGEKHDAELAGNDVEFLIPERQSQRVGLSPRDAAPEAFARSSAIK